MATDTRPPAETSEVPSRTRVPTGRPPRPTTRQRVLASPLLWPLLALGVLTWARVVSFERWETGAWCVVLALVVIYRHRRNIELWISARRDASSTG